MQALMYALMYVQGCKSTLRRDRRYALANEIEGLVANLRRRKSTNLDLK